MVVARILEMTFQLIFFKPEIGLPIAQVCLGQYAQNEDGTPLVTQQCSVFGDLEYAIDELHKELDQLKAEARRKFRPL